ncbi:hypothetical protein [Panacibacter ginsenosidivorans]|uniref:hypothetical protein n=1 Tax=Panacibacter ginsenosidivorans TaxID=1813871 RepID=UPI001315404C|nr:hypothetical protein [Panacibacter ginsenosidivorans]
METIELKKKLIEMIEAIDDEEILYLIKEDIVFQVTSKSITDTTADHKAEEHGLMIVK